MQQLVSKSQGFTLVELIATIGILAIAAVGLFSSLSFALRHQSEGIWQAKVSRLADSYMEQILTRRFDELTPLGGVPACNPKPQTPNPKPQTPNPKPQTPNP